MLSNQTNSGDFVILIKYEDVLVPVHKSKLIAKSKFFETAFSDRWLANNPGANDGEETIVSYRLQIQDVRSSAVKYLFEDLENDSKESYVKSLVKEFDFPLLYDILNLIDFYDIDQSVLEKYKVAMEGYKPQTRKQNLDVIQVVEKIREKEVLNPCLRDLSDKAVKAVQDEFLTKMMFHHKAEEYTSKSHRGRSRSKRVEGKYSNCNSFLGDVAYIPFENLKLVADIMSENKDRLDVVATLFNKMKFDPATTKGDPLMRKQGELPDLEAATLWSLESTMKD